MSTPAYITAWRKANPDKVRATYLRYKRKDPEAFRAKQRESRRLRLAAMSPEQRRDRHLRHNYGPEAPAHKAAQFAEQHGLCAICKTELIVNGGDQDHNHANNKLRGVLCKPCNVGLYYVETPEYKLAAEEYLRKWEHINGV